jgi:UDP-N-acetylmuramate--alanine ligase
MDPTISVGGILDAIGGNIRVGSSELFLTEACEYTNSFLHFYPKYSIILNIEEDHLDFFKDLDDIRHSFRLFAQNTKDNGAVIINGSIADHADITKDLPCQVITYGLAPENTVTAADITYNENGCGVFTLVKDGAPLTRISLGVAGTHNIENALAASALCLLLGLTPDEIANGLSVFHGTDRRFQLKGTLGGIRIYDDYAHHPTEITATLNTARKICKGRLICVFQPHTYTRTKAFFADFARALSLADVVVLADIYAARETDTLGISSSQLRDEVEKNGCEAYYFSSFEKIENFLLQKCMNGDLLITMGAGDILTVGEKLLGI